MSDATGNSTRRKRKADKISTDEEDVAVDVPHLPASVWGGILDFMPYGEVRSALLVGKHIAVQAVKHVGTISVLNASEMYVPAARRFRNVTGINVLCLVNGAIGRPLFGLPGSWRDIDRRPTVSMDAATMAVPFLCSFEKLERVCFGGLIKMIRPQPIDGESHYFERIWYNHLCKPEEGPEDHSVVFKTLLNSLLGAFQSRAIGPNLEMEGVLRRSQFPCSNWTYRMRRFQDQVIDPECCLCRGVMEYFPLSATIPVVEREGPPSLHTGTCLEQEVRIDITRRRSGGIAALEKIGIRRNKPRRIRKNKGV